MNRSVVLRMRPSRWAGVALAVGLVLALGSDLHAQVGSRVTLNQDGVLVIDGQKVFPIGFTMPLPPEALAPSGTALDKVESCDGVSNACSCSYSCSCSSSSASSAS